MVRENGHNLFWKSWKMHTKRCWKMMENHFHCSVWLITWLKRLFPQLCLVFLPMKCYNHKQRKLVGVYSYCFQTTVYALIMTAINHSVKIHFIAPYIANESETHYRVGQKVTPFSTIGMSLCHINCKTPYTVWTIFTFAINYLQFKCVHLFEYISIILSEPQRFSTRTSILWIKHR